MPINIVTRTIGTADQRCSVVGGRIARLSSWADDWTQMRVGVRITPDTGLAANITGTPNWWLGVCSGTSLIPGDATTTHFVGAKVIDATWPYQAGANGGWYNVTMRAAKRVISTDTASAASAAGIDFTNESASKRFVYILDIVKGSPNYTIKIFAPTSFNALDTSLAEFEALMAAATPSRTNYTYSGGLTIAVDEATDGLLNAGCFWWDNASLGMEISDFEMVKLV